MLGVQPSSCVLHGAEVIVYGPAFDESALVESHHLW
jgi:hypothetical protein